MEASLKNPRKKKPRRSPKAKAVHSRDKTANAAGTSANAKRFASEVEVSSIFAIPVRTLQKWRMFRTGPPARKFGKSVRYEIRAVEDWANSQPIVGGNEVDG